MTTLWHINADHLPEPFRKAAEGGRVRSRAALPSVRFKMAQDGEMIPLAVEPPQESQFQAALRKLNDEDRMLRTVRWCLSEPAR